MIRGLSQPGSRPEARQGRPPMGGAQPSQQNGLPLAKPMPAFPSPSTLPLPPEARVGLDATNFSPTFASSALPSCNSYAPRSCLNRVNILGIRIALALHLQLSELLIPGAGAATTTSWASPHITIALTTAAAVPSTSHLHSF
ncbi:hypothetical protein BGW80DRAFT_1454830 [Lactifluus volemus]|nr:hypothetical protein BGW80DRAFT_1454830 [Lactifluus volemus]